MEWRSAGVLETSTPKLQYSITPFLGSVNAKQLEQPALQAGRNRCKSGHGCHCPQGVRVCACLSAKEEVRGASPREGTILMVAMI
jgi:hypothetical protein